MKKQIKGIKIIISLLLIVVMMVFSSCSINIIGRERFTEADTDLSVETSENQQPVMEDGPMILPITYNNTYTLNETYHSSNEYYKFYTSDNYDVLEVKYHYSINSGGNIIKLYFDENGKIQNNNIVHYDYNGDIISSESMFIKYDEQSNISLVSLNDYRCDYTYDSLGRIIEIKEVKPYITGFETCQFEYDEQNRLTNFTIYSVSTEFEYNDKGLITGITETSKNNVIQNAKTTINYNENGQVASTATNYVYGPTDGSLKEHDYAYDDSNNLIFKSTYWGKNNYEHTEYEYSDNNGAKTINTKDLSSKYVLFNDTQVSSLVNNHYDNIYTHDYEYETLTKEQAYMYDIYNKYFTFLDIESRPFYVDSFSPTSQAKIMIDTLPYLHRYISDDSYYPYLVYKAIIDIYK